MISLGILAGQSKQFATWNPAGKGAGVSLSNGNLTVTNTALSMVRATLGKSAGKWYWEMLRNNSSGGSGIANAAAALNSYPGGDTNGWSYWYSGLKYTNAVGLAYGATFTTGDIIGCALDMDAGTISFYKNGVLQGVAYSGLSGVIYPAAGQTGGSTTTNFGATPFAYPVPEGFNAGVFA